MVRRDQASSRISKASFDTMTWTLSISRSPVCWSGHSVVGDALCVATVDERVCDADVSVNHGDVVVRVVEPAYQRRPRAFSSRDAAVTIDETPFAAMTSSF